MGTVGIIAFWGMMRTAPITKPCVPCILHEDRHLVVVHKPAGISTHRAGEDAPWGMVEFLSSQRPDLGGLGIHQRLDRETSGVLVFARSPEANRALADQFQNRSVRKRYLLVTKSGAPQNIFTVAKPVDGKPAKTHFRYLREIHSGFLWEAGPITGRTHQVRLHAAACGIPIVGETDNLKSPRETLLLHAVKLEIIHPQNGQPLMLEAPMPSYFEMSDSEQRQFAAACNLRQLLINPKETNAYRLIHRESDGFPKLTVDRLSSWFYVEDFGGRDDATWLSKAALDFGETKGTIFLKVIQGTRRENKRLLWGEPPPKDFAILENGIHYQLDPLLPGGIGLFLDQRENRRRIRSLAGELRVLNLFAYTCGFSVAAAMGGAVETVNVDLSRRALEWGRRNFRINGLDPALHHFWAQDVTETLRKLTSRKERFGVVIIDPPSSSRSKSGGHFSVKKDLGKLTRAATPLLDEGGWLFVSSNLVGWKNSAFLVVLEKEIRSAGRKIVERVWMPQPFDFPTCRDCPTYLKSVWLRLE